MKTPSWMLNGGAGGSRSPGVGMEVDADADDNADAEADAEPEAEIKEVSDAGDVDGVPAVGAEREHGVVAGAGARQEMSIDGASEDDADVDFVDAAEATCTRFSSRSRRLKE